MAYIERDEESGVSLASVDLAEAIFLLAGFFLIGLIIGAAI